MFTHYLAVTSVIEAAMEEALKRILTPKRTIDVLREARAAKQSGDPFTIVFVGVNGTLKLCYLFSTNPLI